MIFFRRVETKQMKNKQKKLSATGLLVAMGIVYGDIGTSPLYVMKAIVGENGGIASINPDFILGTVSLIFWTLTLLTTVKYVLLALNADNRGEGGIFSLYTLVRKKSKYLVIPAMIGGAALLADGVLTPAVTVTTAIEGLRGIPFFYENFGTNQNVIIGITLGILLVLFGVQRFGSDSVGKAFGPIMFVWFTFLGVVGIINFSQDFSIIRAFNPIYGLRLLLSPDNKLGILILGNVFLSTTGAEALYSDMGHVGKQNIRVSWPYVKVCLLLNYLGQAVWLNKARENAHLYDTNGVNPFFLALPEGWLTVGVILATISAVIASQALLSGTFTLVSEAIKLKLLPHLKIIYPGSSIGQVYVPAINMLLWVVCSAVVIGFRTSSRMEAAYGLAITVTMLMTTILLYFYLMQTNLSKILSIITITFFGLIETVFFISSAAKFFHGGFVAVLIALVILFVMIIWEKGDEIEQRESELVNMNDYLPQLIQLQKDDLLPLYQTNVVFLVSKLEQGKIGKQFMYSILDKKPKRAKVYWFVNVEVTDDPYTQEYEIDMMGTDFIVQLKLCLGFRISQEVNVYIRQIIKELMSTGRLPKQPQKYTITPGREIGDFQFILIHESLSNNTELSKWDRQIMQMKLFIKKHTTSPENWFGLENSETKHETIPLVIGQKRETALKEKNQEYSSYNNFLS